MSISLPFSSLQVPLRVLLLVHCSNVASLLKKWEISRERKEKDDGRERKEKCG